jgi:hypothetical protein
MVQDPFMEGNLSPDHFLICVFAALRDSIVFARNAEKELLLVPGSSGLTGLGLYMD